jgi:hypothetical protein
MKNQVSQLEKKAETKAQRREKKKRPRMKVSGKSVFRLREAIRKRGRT